MHVINASLEFSSQRVTTLVIVLIPIVIMIFVVVYMMRQYKRCPPGKALVVTGKTSTGRPECHIGGGVLVIPMLQDCALLDLAPFEVSLPQVRVQSSDGLAFDACAHATAAISSEAAMVSRAAIHLLGMEPTTMAQKVGGVMADRMAACASGLASSSLETPVALTEAMNTNHHVIEELGIETMTLTVTRIARVED